MKTKSFITNKEVVLNHPAINDVLIYDIETDSLDTKTAECVYFGAYSYRNQKYYIINGKDHQEIQNLISSHKVLVGFNNKEFDGPILENITNRYDLQYKIVFDCLSVLYDYKRKRPNRETVIKVNGKSLQEQLPNRKLKTVVKALGFPSAKGDIDYNVFKKEAWTKEEIDEIETYLFKDVEITRMLFEFYVEYFEPYKEYVNKDSIRKFDYIRSSLGSYTYSALCNLAGIEPEFEDDKLKLLQRPLNSGGFVLKPQASYAEGTIIYADFASLYPHIMIMCNLFEPVINDYNGKTWDGGKMFPDLQTKYKADKQGKIEEVLKNIYMKRKEYKKVKDPRQLALKIMINTIYGLSGSPIFKNVFNMTTSGDTTYIGRTCINYVRQKFEENGYKVIYGDTDSCFVVLPENQTIDDYQKISDEIIKNILENVPFPAKTFNLDIDDVFRKIWLFGKKNYCGINKDGKLIIKGLPIIKHNATQLGMKILERIKPLILEQDSIKFEKSFFEKIIDEELRNDITLIAQVYNVRNPSSYKSPSSIQCQIANKFGEGSYLLIPNKSLGDIGKSKKYCLVEEGKNLTISDLFLEKVWNELEPFIK